jgi:ubiquinone biosynthesis protein
MVAESFGETPLGAATIAQVHEATLPDGRRVAVKVQRPGLGAMISTDIAALSYLVALGETLFPRLRRLDLPVVVREFAKSLDRETDFNREARSIVLFRTAMADFPDLWIPDVVASTRGEACSRWSSRPANGWISTPECTPKRCRDR